MRQHAHAVWHLVIMCLELLGLQRQGHGVEVIDVRMEVQEKLCNVQDYEILSYTVVLSEMYIGKHANSLKQMTYDLVCTGIG